MVCLTRPYPFKFFKGCLPQNLLSSLMNTLSHISLRFKFHDAFRFQGIRTTYFIYNYFKVIPNRNPVRDESQQTHTTLLRCKSNDMKYYGESLFVSSKAKGRISKRVFQENKARWIFRKTNISYPWYAHALIIYNIFYNFYYLAQKCIFS